MKKVSDYVAEFLAGAGTEEVFLLPGGACMHLVDSVGAHPALRPVCLLHEQAVAVAAEAHAQVSGRCGVALVTAGPGSTNAITGVAGAWIDSTPLLVISGQAKTTDLIGSSGLRQMGVQEVDITEIVAPITKLARRVTRPREIRHALEQALQLATSGRPGPVWLDLPLDVQGALVEPEALDGFVPAASPQAEADLAPALDRVLGLLQGCQRPVILAGNGIRLAGAQQPFVRLVERLGVPVLTTWRTVDLLPEDHPCYFGRPGSIAQRGANLIQQNADLLLVIGARLDLPQVGFDHAGFAPAAKKVVVDVDRAEIDKLKLPIEVSIQSGADRVIEGLLARAVTPELDLGPWVAQCRRWMASYPLIDPDAAQAPGPVNPYVLVDLLSEQLDSEDLIVPGSSGACSEIPLQAFRIKAGQRLVNSPGLGAMGFGLPAAIGACLAAGGRRTISIDGDGGFQMNIQELATLAGLDLPIKIFVLSNGGYGSIRFTQSRHFSGRFVCCDEPSGLYLPDLLPVVAGYGVATRAIADHAELRERLPEILAAPGPLVCEVTVDRGVITAPRLSSVVNRDGSIESRPMQDLWPFLERDELEQQMLDSPGRPAKPAKQG